MSDKVFKRILQKITINSSRRYLEKFIQDGASVLKSGEYVLDAGAGEHFYKRLYENRIYHSTDIQKNNTQVSFISDLSFLPIANEKYDLIICTQVLEHVQEPEKVLYEFHRTLKPTGQLWLTVPLYFEEHEIPMDYFRFTQFGIKHLISKAGFKIRKLEWLEGYFGTVSYEMVKTARMLPAHPRAYGHRILGIPFSILSIFLKLFCYLLGLFFSRLDVLYKYTASGHPKNYAVIATKEGRCASSTTSH